MGSLLPGGWTELRQQNHQLVLQGRRVLCEALGVQPPCPEEMIGSMAVVPMPTTLENRDFMSIHDELFEKFGIQVQLIPWREKSRLLVRLSAQIYNTLEQYKYLAKVLKGLCC